MWWLLLFLTLLLVKYWQLALFILFCYGVYKAIEWAPRAYERKKAAQREAERRLIRNADREHKLVQQGNVDGIYGEYPVPDECRGIGIWLTEKS